MDQRPPTSRVKTGGNRPKTAAQGRPPTSVGARPSSRRGNSEEPPATPSLPPAPPTAMTMRAVSRATVSSRVGSRAGPGPAPGLEGRITTAQIPEGTLRPTTQQGFGARPASRLKTGMSGRQIADKTYYVGLLNTQLASLEAEIESLGNELAKIDREQRNLLIYEQKAEEQAEEIKRLQGEMADYNLLIDRQNTNLSINDLEMEIHHQQQHNDDLTRAIEDLFHERQQREEACRHLEEQIDTIKQNNLHFIDEMGVSRKEEFEQVKGEMEDYRSRVDETQQQINELTAEKEKLDLSLAKYPLKQHAMNLQEQISALKDKKTQLESEVNVKGTPEEQKDALIEEIKKNNAETEKLQAQIDELEAQVQLTQEELREFENDIELIAGEDDRYRDYKNKERQFDEFLNSFESKKVEIGSNLAQKQAKTLSLLRSISANCQRDELAAQVTGLDQSAVNMAMNNSANPGELRELHVRLQEELISLDEAESHHRAELESLNKQQEFVHKIQVDWESFATKRSELEKSKKAIQSERDSLTLQLQQEQSEFNELFNEFSSLDSRLKANVFFDQLRELKNRLELAEEEKRRILEELKAKEAEFDYKSLKTEAMQLRSELNSLLRDGNNNRTYLG